MRQKVIKITAFIFLALVLLFGASLFYVQMNKEEILSSSFQKIQERVKGNLVVGKKSISLFKNFPWPSVHFSDVKLTDELVQQHGFTLFEAKDVYLSVDIIDAIKGRSPIRGIRIDNGNAYLFTDTLGQKNTDVFLKSEKKSPAPDIRKIELNNFTVTIDDRRKPKFHKFTAKKLSINPDITGNGYRLNSDVDIYTDSLSFNRPKGGYLRQHRVRGKFENTWSDDGILKFKDQKLNINGQAYRLSGDFNTVQKVFALSVQTENIPYEKVKVLLTTKARNALSAFSIDRFDKVEADIKGSLAGGQPLILVKTVVKNSVITSPFMDFSEATFNVTFFNRSNSAFLPSDSNTNITIDGFKAKWRGIPATSKQIQISNLVNPVLKCDLASSFQLSLLDKVLSSRTIAFRKGDAQVNILYQGPVKRNEATNALINGIVSISGGAIVYKPRQIQLDDVDARISFRDSDVYIDKLNTSTLGQVFYMKGYGKQLMTLIQTAPSLATLNWEINTPNLDISRLLWLLKKPEATNDKASNGIPGLANKIDDVIEKGRINVKMSTPSVRYGEFNARDLLANVSLLEDQYVLNNVSMTHAGGSFAMNGSLASMQGSHNVKLDVNMKDVDVSEVFASFNNFGQDGLVSQSIAGRLSSRAIASFRLSNEGKILPSTLTSVIDFSLLNGALINYEPVKKLQRFIFKNRDFDNIRFAELKNRLEVKDREVKINRMEINSSVMWMYVEGLYSQRGNTDISIQVPLKNLKKRDELNPENAGLKNGGSSIYIRGRPGEDGNIKFKLDLFNRYDKSKK